MKVKEFRQILSHFDDNLKVLVTLDGTCYTIYSGSIYYNAKEPDEVLYIDADGNFYRPDGAISKNEYGVPTVHLNE